jgi:hypothetical protein
MPEEKEVDFFSYRFDHGYQWYEHLFGTNDSRLKTGEVSPSYFHDPAAPGRVGVYRPDMKILLTLRDPIQRAMSNHRHEIRLGHLTGSDLSFEAGMANNPMYIEQGLYAKHLRNWLAHFPKQQILVVLMDDIEADPGRVAREVFRFLDIDDTFQPASLTRRYNQSIANRFQMLFRAKEHAYHISRKAGMGWLWSAGTSLGIRSLYRRVNTAACDGRVPPMSSASKRLLRRAFADDIRDLEVLLGRNLTHWLEDTAAVSTTPVAATTVSDIPIATKAAR